MVLSLVAISGRQGAEEDDAQGLEERGGKERKGEAQGLGIAIKT